MPTSINDQPETDESPRSGRADVEISALKVNGEMVDENGSSDREIWLEVMVVLAVTWLPYFAYSITWWIWPDPPQRTSFMAESIWDLTTNFVDIVVVLYIIHRGHTPWRVHGIKKPRIFVDLSLAFSTWIAMTTVLFLVLRFVVSIVGLEFANAMTTSIHVFDRPSSTADFVVLPFLALSIGVSEELAMRGYLIPRCEQLLGSTPKSILVSSLLFASYHLYQGVGSSMVIFVVGSVFGIAFCWSRRLWPVAIAHAAMDLLALS
jgi:membrane protease YdiL (CAAX protease family)